MHYYLEHVYKHINEFRRVSYNIRQPDFVLVNTVNIRRAMYEMGRDKAMQIFKLDETNNIIEVFGVRCILTTSIKEDETFVVSTLKQD
jgi:hypothetical protein